MSQQTETHLCEKCAFQFPTCNANHILFGCDLPFEGPNPDAVIQCDTFHPGGEIYDEARPFHSEPDFETPTF